MLLKYLLYAVRQTQRQLNRKGNKLTESTQLKNIGEAHEQNCNTHKLYNYLHR